MERALQNIDAIIDSEDSSLKPSSAATENNDKEQEIKTAQVHGSINLPTNENIIENIPLSTGSDLNVNQSIFNIDADNSTIRNNGIITETTKKEKEPTESMETVEMKQLKEMKEKELNEHRILSASVYKAAEVKYLARQRTQKLRAERIQFLQVRTASGRHNIIHGHNMSQWVETTDLCFKTDSKSVIFSDGSYYVHHWTVTFTDCVVVAVSTAEGLRNSLFVCRAV